MPGVWRRGHFLVPIVDGDRGRIGFDGEFGADVAGWHAVAVAVEDRRISL